MKIYLTIVDYDGDLEKKKNHFYFLHKGVGLVSGFVKEDFSFYFNGQTEKYFKLNYNIYVKRLKCSVRDFAKQINESVKNVEIMIDVLEINKTGETK